MPIPDNTYFGERPEGGAIKYGEVRKITDEQKQLEILKYRLDPLLIGQINELVILDEFGKRKVYSPFPLTVLCLLSIETIGWIISDEKLIKATYKQGYSKAIVTSVYQLMDQKLADKPSDKFFESFKEIHNIADTKGIKRYSDIIHTYQRNTFTHGYQSKGVYLTEQIEIAVYIDEEVGCLYINPYPFWELFKKTYEEIFDAILSNKNPEWRQNAIKYFNKLLC